MKISKQKKNAQAAVTNGKPTVILEKINDASRTK